jgi:hypothetical protein
MLMPLSFHGTSIALSGSAPTSAISYMSCRSLSSALRRVGSQFKDEMLCERITVLPLITARAAFFTMVKCLPGDARTGRLLPRCRAHL